MAADVARLRTELATAEEKGTHRTAELLRLSQSVKLVLPWQTSSFRFAQLFTCTKYKMYIYIYI